MNWRSTLVLVAVFLGLLVFAYSQRNVTPIDIGKGPPTGTPEPLANLTLDVVEEVSVVGPSGSYTLTKVFGGWEVDGQKAKPEVKDTLEQFVKLQTQGTVPGEVKPEDYGFATPAMTVTIRTEEGAAKVLQVGDEVPGEAAYYVRLEGGKTIYLLSNYELNQLKDWLTEKPYQPTWTPTATPTTVEATPTPEASAIATASPTASQASPSPAVSRAPSSTPRPPGTARPTSRPASTSAPTATKKS